MPEEPTPPEGSLFGVRVDEGLKIGVLISGSGTNLQAVMDACADGRIEGKVAVVISNHADAYGLERARRAGIPTVFHDFTKYNDYAKYNAELKRILLDEYEVGLVVMAGYMRLLGRQVLDAFPGRVMNIHPALLPAFPGASGIQDAYEYGVKVTGVTVHFADEHFDKGPIILQRCVEVAERDTLESLEAKIHDIEHELYPLAVKLFAEDRLRIEGRKVRILA